MKPTLKLYTYYVFIEWLATPDYYKHNQGLPETQEEFAAEHNVDKSTLSRWKQDPNYKEDLRRAQARWSIDKTPNVNMGLYAKACKGDPMAVKLWYQIFEGWTEKSKVEHGGEIKQSIHIEIKEEKRLQIIAAFQNFGLIKPTQKNDATTGANIDHGAGGGDNLGHVLPASGG